MIGENIKKYRKKLKLTQEELGKMIGVSGVAIMRYEKDQREPNLDTIDKIAVALDVTIWEILGYDDESVRALALGSKHIIMKSEEDRQLMKLAEDEARRKNLIPEHSPDRAALTALTHLRELFIYLKCVDKINDEDLADLLKSDDLKYSLAFAYQKQANKIDFSEIKMVEYTLKREK